MHFFFFFFSSRRRHTRCSRDWSSDVCSSDLLARELERLDPIVHLGEVRRPDRARAPRPTAGNRFMLERFHKLLMLEALLGRGHVAPIVSPRGRAGKLSFS